VNQVDLHFRLQTAHLPVVVVPALGLVLVVVVVGV
jgi:hypothetical protein